jgi:CRP-like cAMP-binding protein
MTLSNVEALKKSELFRELDDGNVEKLAVRVRHLSYGPDNVLFRQGDPGLSLYIVASGQVRINLESVPGRDIVPALLGPGETFGELAVLDGLPRSATATTTTDTELLMLSREDLLTLLEEDPVAMKAMLRNLAGVIRLIDENWIINRGSPHERMNRRLLDLAKWNGVPHEWGTMINRVVQTSELAGMTQLSRNEVEKILADYQYWDFIRMDDGRIVIRHPEKPFTWDDR